MIILDTNVLWELVRPEPEANVLNWVDSLDASAIATTSITAAELLYGVARLPGGRRRRELGEAIEGLIDQDLSGRVEPFDAAAARHYSELVSLSERAGRSIGVSDGQIAAICRKLGATLATRNTSDFRGTDIDLIDPWRQ